MTVLVVVSDDYWGGEAAEVCAKFPNVIVAVDKSSSWRRAVRLVFRGSIPIPAIVRMMMAGFQRSRTRPAVTNGVSSNADLRALCSQFAVETVILFRAALIVSDKTLQQGKIMNIHCADIVDFGGLAAIYRALKAGKYNQHATLHKITIRIDQGEILDVEPFQLDERGSYVSNEDAAYRAGITLLRRTLERSVSMRDPPAQCSDTCN